MDIYLEIANEINKDISELLEGIDKLRASGAPCPNNKVEEMIHKIVTYHLTADLVEDIKKDKVHTAEKAVIQSLKNIGLVKNK